MTRSDFGALNVIVNHNAIQTVAVDEHRIAPGGFYAFSADGSVQAGLFINAIGGRETSAGGRLLLFERDAQRLSIRQFLGADAFLSLAPPSAVATSQLTVRAYDDAGFVLGTIPSRLENGRIVFVYPTSMRGRPVERVDVLSSSVLERALPMTTLPMVGR